MSPPSVPSSATRARTVAALWLLLLVLAVDTTFVAVTTTADPTTNTTDTTTGTTTGTADNDLLPIKATNEDIYSFVVHSKIKYRYAQTVVSSRVVNKGNTSHELQFYVTLPESAFVSKFLMVINEKVYEAYVKEKKKAKEVYDDAVSSGRTAAHVEQNARDSNKFTVSVNVEAESKVTFNLTYEQLLTRKLGIYENIINLQPGQVVNNLQVIVDIDEPLNITTLEVPDIKTANEIETTLSKNKLAKVSRESGNKATITWSPTVKEQITFSEKYGVKGQFIVKYDVDHHSAPNQVLIDDGYFVHFFAPTELKPLRTHVIFVLDVSGSMSGQKLTQVKDAMDQILSDMNSDDFFTLISFSNDAQVWTREHQNVFLATEQNKQYAKKYIQDLVVKSTTNMGNALNKALATAESEKKSFKDGLNGIKPIIVFLTDGEPNGGINDQQELIKYVSNTNKEKYPIFSLGFGEGADIDFLKKLSLNNNGFARVIYESSDASLQLRSFYKEISSPVLSNVTFQYIDAQVDNVTVTKKSFNLMFKGTELVVAGKLKNGSSSADFNSTLSAGSTVGNYKAPFDVRCLDLPTVPTGSTPNTTRIGHLERLWAYLNIQQLVDNYELNKNEHSASKDKALELALKYSFVTPLTSLVVVKPNDTTTSEVLKKIKPHDNRYNSGANPPWMSMAIPYAPRPNQFGSQDSSAGISLISGALPYLPTHQDRILPLRFHYYPHHYNSRHFFASDIDDFDNDSALLTSDAIATTQTSIIDSDKDSSSTLHSINELPWLGTSITLNETNTVYQVLLNTSGQTYQNCTTPDQTHGNCKHLKDCVVSSILASIDTYLPLFCPIETLYAGICCLV